MPDIFAALIILHAAILLGRFDELTTAQKVVMTALASFAVAAHYGNPPLAFGLFTVAILWRLIIRKWSTADPGGGARSRNADAAFEPHRSAGRRSTGQVPRLSDSLSCSLARSRTDRRGGISRTHAREADLAVCALFRKIRRTASGTSFGRTPGSKGFPARLSSESWTKNTTCSAGLSGLPRCSRQLHFLGKRGGAVDDARHGDLQLSGGIDADLEFLPPGESGADAELRRLAELGIAATTIGSIAIFALAWHGSDEARGRRNLRDGHPWLHDERVIFGGLSAPPTDTRRVSPGCFRQWSCSSWPGAAPRADG